MRLYNMSSQIYLHTKLHSYIPTYWSHETTGVISVIVEIKIYHK